MKRFTLSVFLAGVIGGRTLACDLCAIYSASSARGEIGTGAFAGIAEQFTHFGTVQVDGTKVADPSGQYLDSVISQLFLGYNLNERIGLQFNVPLVYRSFKRPDSMGGIDRGIESGLADVSLLATVVPYRHLSENLTFTWTLLGGVKFPTGSSERIKEEQLPEAEGSGIHGHDLTLGTGSYDGIIGSGIYLRWRRAFLTGTVQYAIRSEGDFHYQFANDLTWGGGPGYYLILGHQYTLALQAVVSGEHKGTDTFQGESAEDTGITAVYLGPQVSFTWDSRLSAQISVDLPLLLDNTALQTVPDYRIRGGLTWHF